jgi:peptide/nickel transport system substrate-binding protein
VTAWKRGDALELVANDAYYRGKPHLRAITVKFVPSATTRALMLTSGELGLAPLDRETYRQIAESHDAGAGQVVFAVAPERAFSAIFLNVTRPALRDVRVRRALAAAVDRRRLVRNSAYGADVATVANGYNGPLSFAYDPQTPAAEYDPALAARLLDAAGWHVGPDGIRTNGTQRLTLLLLARAGRTTEIGVATQLQAMLHRVGIEVTIQTASSEILFAPLGSGGLLAGGKYDLLYTSYFASFDPDSSWILTCDQIEPHGDNESRYCNRQLDALEAAGLATYDVAARKRIYAQIDRLVDRDVPMIFVAWPTIVYGMNVHLLGFAFNGTSATWNAGRWQLALHIDPHR